MPLSNILHRRQVILTALLLPVLGVQAKPARVLIEVWKSPTCGCCKDWVSHLQDNGFEVQLHELSEPAKAAQRARLGMPEKFGSCHTALVRGYVVEGHVPAGDIQTLLKQVPTALGLAAPGMPVGSPGMDGPAYGGHRDPYAVMLVRRDGSASVYAQH
jgi:hypothetical protein